MRFLEVGEIMLSPRNEHHFLGAAIGGIFGTLQQSSANIVTGKQIGRAHV